MTTTTDNADLTRRDFLYVATGTVGAVGTALALWPFIDQMNPDASVIALASTEFDLAPLEEGQGVTIKWRGKPVFVRHRTKKEIEEAKNTPLAELKDPIARNANLPPDAPATDENRVKDATGKVNEKYLIQIGICTHLGCVPQGEAGEYHGWFCNCHGSVYDTAGRIRKGPAPRNLDIPPYKYITDTKIVIG
ncbi:ubiquinol-cytochrome c reductase iron-sulfur subunit [Thermopetrobacter sp. TC1]|uniref:ubiquinol-cytochrome c reductase iron-sulfur subunit n=1 Tax=Thermopetrobacter sp. TC1 TaxID=1495045 RepID=UPI00056E72ED|nr:ubiquinol-cytochrome c reductase iron-sulfur subunit [Thermopetrobacter sp. TC1]